MHLSRLQLALIVFGGVILGPSMGDAQDRAPVPSGQFALDIVPGPEYSASTSLLLFIKIPLYPQIACWIETPDGQFVDTVYVTSKGAKKSFFSAPASGRPEALPVWYHLQSKAASSIDAVSSATAASASEHKAKFGASLAPGRYQVFLEVNRSYDYNATYTKANSGVNGQPSVIYRAELTVGKDPNSASFIPIGTGSVDGSSGGVAPGLDGITTALKIIKDAEIRYGGE